MPHEPSRPQAGPHPLTGSPPRLARRDLDYARSEDLAQLPAAGLILLIERLRGRLDDTLTLVDEIAAPRADLHD